MFLWCVVLLRGGGGAAEGVMVRVGAGVRADSVLHVRGALAVHHVATCCPKTVPGRC